MTHQRTPNYSTAAPTRPPRALRLRPSLIQRTRRERKSFNGALVASALVHALLLSQLVGGDGQGLAGFVLPWQARRIKVPDVQVVLTPVPVAPAGPVDPPAAVSVQRASIRPPPADVPTPTPSAPPAPRQRSRVVADVPVARPATNTEVVRNTVADAVPVKVPPSADVPDRVRAPPPPAPSLEPAVLTAAPSGAPTPVVPVAVAPTPAIAVEPSASSPDPVALAAREAAQEAQRQEAARQQAIARAETARLDAERQESARQATARTEAARLETERQAAARQAAAAQLESQRQEAVRQTTARAEAARLETERQELARQAAAQQEAARAQAAQDTAAATVAAAVAKREALLRAIGRQLDEENARRDAARPSSVLPLSLNTARRIRLWGHTNPNAELVEYAQAWASKIHLNTAPDTVRDVAKQPHTPPTVVVALRSDGSVESVVFSVSSGVAEVDAAIRRIVESQRPYPAFPPALAREFDVIEIRRTWHFDAAVRLH